MIIQEAISRIIDHKLVHKFKEKNAIYIDEALTIAIRILNKQIIKTVNSNKLRRVTAIDVVFTQFPCPECGKYIEYKKTYKYCPYCGQRVELEV